MRHELTSSNGCHLLLHELTSNLGFDNKVGGAMDYRLSPIKGTVFHFGWFTEIAYLHRCVDYDRGFQLDFKCQCKECLINEVYSYMVQLFLLKSFIK